MSTSSIVNWFSKSTFIYWLLLFITYYLNMVVRNKEQWLATLSPSTFYTTLQNNMPPTIFYTNPITEAAELRLVILKLSFIISSPPLLTPEPVPLQTLQIPHPTVFPTDLTVFKWIANLPENLLTNSTMLVMTPSKTSLSTLSRTSVLWPKTISYIHWKT